MMSALTEPIFVPAFKVKRGRGQRRNRRNRHAVNGRRFGPLTKRAHAPASMTMAIGWLRLTRPARDAR